MPMPQGCHARIIEPYGGPAREGMTRIAEILERSRANGPMRDAPLAFVVALANAVADATIDFVLADPDNADARARDGFEALWRAIA